MQIESSQQLLVPLKQKTMNCNHCNFWLQNHEEQQYYFWKARLENKIRAQRKEVN